MPISAVQQRSRNNGQVQDEDWWLACGKGQVHIEHVPTGWFSSATIKSLNDVEKFENSILKTAKSGSTLEEITSIGNETSRQTGYYANLSNPDGDVCQVGKFGVRAKNGRTFDNDSGAIDTFVEVNYCGQYPLDTAALTSSLKLSKSDESYVASLKQNGLAQCSTIFEETENTAPLDKQRSAELTLIWPGAYYGSQKMAIDYNLNFGAFSIALSDTNQCDGHYEAKSPETPFEARWWLLCDDGRSAKGYFYPENQTSLMGKGQDAKGVEILLGIEL